MMRFVGFLFLAITAVGADESLRLWYGAPATKWEQAIPLGNGRFGAMVFGGATQEHMQLNEDTLYSGYPGHRDLPLRITDDFATMTNLIAQRQFAAADRPATTKWLGAAQACYQPLGDLFLNFEHTYQRHRPDAKQVAYDGKGMFFNARVRIRTKGGKITADAAVLAVAGADEALVFLWRRFQLQRL